MPANNRSDIAIETAEAIGSLLLTEKGFSDAALHVGLDRASQVIGTFIAATRLHQGPRVGRPRKPKAEG